MLKSLFILLLSSFKTNSQLRLELLFLTKQIEILQRNSPRLKIKETDKLIFSLVKTFLSNWKERIFIVKPNTLVKWHKNAFRLYWYRISRGKKNGRPRVNKELICLIRQIANENPFWGAPRIHGELKKLGFDVSESTVQRYILRRNSGSTDQKWKTFLKNHIKETVSIDFFTIPTINFKMVNVLVVLDHHRRKIIHFNVTMHPTTDWILQQLRNVFSEHTVPKYLIRDRDSKYGSVFSNRIKQFGIKEYVTSYRSPWQNGYVERVIGSIKRECLDHIVIINENHLRKVLKDYISYYNKYRTHLANNKDSPEGREVQVVGKIEKVPVLNGLHNIYLRKAA